MKRILRFRVGQVKPIPEKVPENMQSESSSASPPHDSETDGSAAWRRRPAGNTPYRVPLMGYFQAKKRRRLSRRVWHVLMQGVPP